ncbi:helix-turn-helix domain-containing protein [Pseudovibrio ascidiaceicola]|uniref:helix-turn-helix domain-containing protein n=1 Tax=Pseudovibrio ascidiaceicola TaxID=285279 RepID=UPI003D35EE8B
MTLATRLKDLRIGKRQSLQDVADAVGVSKTHVWELEKGRSLNPSLEMLTKLATNFDVTVRFLIGEDYESAKDPQIEKMFRQVSSLDTHDRKILEEMVQTMAKMNEAKKREKA